MKRILFALSVIWLPLAGCTSSGGEGPTTVAATESDRAAFVGTWTGALDSGASVRVRVPATGNASYSFKGGSVPISATRKSGGSLVLSLTNGGSVRLSPTDGGLSYSYRYGGQSASTTLSRS